MLVAGACNQLYSHGPGRKSLHERRSFRLGSLDVIAAPVRAVTSVAHSCDARDQEQASRYFLTHPNSYAGRGQRPQLNPSLKRVM
jgi:hypothetical protein